MTDKSDPRLYVALDLPSLDDARAMVKTLGDTVISYKIGLQLLPLGGAAFGRELAAQGKNVFLDFKLHDIDATVEKATRSIAGIGADLLTVHARPDVMQAAAKGAGDSDLKILGVTVLTSLDQEALDAIGYYMSPEELVMRRVDQALEAGIDGVVAVPKKRPKSAPMCRMISSLSHPAFAWPGMMSAIKSVSPRPPMRLATAHLILLSDDL